MSFLCQNQGVDKVLGYGHMGLSGYRIISCYVSYRVYLLIGVIGLRFIPRFFPRVILLLSLTFAFNIPLIICS